MKRHVQRRCRLPKPMRNSRNPMPLQSSRLNEAPSGNTNYLHEDYRYQLSAIYCPASFFTAQNSSACCRSRFPFCTATSINAWATPSPIPLLPTLKMRPSSALMTNQTKAKH
jgi:hypothetical protein